MNDFNLDSELRKARVPERGEEFWGAFPERVMAELHATPAVPATRAAPPHRMAWNFGLALACVAVGFCLWQTRMPQTFCYALIQKEREMRQEVRQFPTHLRALMDDEHGLGKLVEDKQ